MLCEIYLNCVGVSVCRSVTEEEGTFRLCHFEANVKSVYGGQASIDWKKMKHTAM